jgi:hypothetical protein
MKKLKVMLIFILIIIVFVIAKKFQRIENGFGMVTVSPAFELDGKGKNVDSIAFWETPDSSSTLMFVTAKDNDLLEVWQYPFIRQQKSKRFLLTRLSTSKRVWSRNTRRGGNKH